MDMKTKLKAGALAALIAFGSNLIAQKDIYTPTFNLDFKEELDTIKQTSRAAQPLQKTLSKGIQELKESIENAKQNPNPLTKSEFELKYAGYIQKVVRDMDELIVHRDQAAWAFEDITMKIQEVNHRLKSNYARNKERVARKQHEINKHKDELKELARQIERVGAENAPKELQRKLRTLHRKYKYTLVNLRSLQALEKQQKAIAESLIKYELSMAEVNSNLESWFEGLLGLRDAFREMAETKSDLNEIRRLIFQPGIGSVGDTIKKLSDVMNKLDEFSETMLTMNSSIAELSGVDVSTLEPTSVDDILSEVLNDEF